GTEPINVVVIGERAYKCVVHCETHGRKRFTYLLFRLGFWIVSGIGESCECTVGFESFEPLDSTGYFLP
ncbi:hypothetical protein L195_g051424, partial [Trifolium pratense]